VALTAEEIDLLLEETKKIFLGRRVRKVYHLEPHELYLAFRAEGKKVFLFLTTRPRVSRFHALWEAGPFPPRPSPFCETLRAALSGKPLTGAGKLAGNRAVRFDFGSEGDALVGEFFGARGNIVLLKGGAIVDSLWPIRREGRRFRPGHAYRLPPPPEETFSRQHPRYLLRRGSGPYPFSTALAELMRRKERELVFGEKRNKIRARIRRERKRRERLLARLAADKKAAEEADKYRRFGEALKCRLNEVPRGLSEVTLPDPFEPGAELVIPLDPALSARENLARLFQRYRKLRDALPVVTERYEKCARRIAGLDEAAEALESLSWDREEDEKRLEELARRFGPGGRAGKEGGGKGPKVTAPRGVRRFVLRDHMVWVGRNERENAELVRRTARGNDLFLHVAGRPGAVVIVRAPPGKEVAPEVLGDAALLAVYYTAGRAGGTHEVDYTRVKYVRPLGKEPGRFSLGDRRSLRVTVEAAKLQSILAELKP